MGKYPNSRIHAEFSDWHKKKCGPASTLTDIDRLWVEIDYNNEHIICVMDLKYLDSLYDKELTKCEWIAANELEEKDIPWYTVWLSRNFEQWKVVRHKTGKQISFNEESMIRWLDQRCPEF